MGDGTEVNLQCNPESDAKVTDGVTKIYCRADVDENIAAYMTPLIVNFKYGYKNSVSSSLEIRKGIDEP